MSLKQAILTEAHRLGFDLAGVTSPDPPPHLDAFRSWLGAGRHAGMDYLATERSVERRSDPRRILPECRSILVLGMCYQPAGKGISADSPETGQETAGRIAAGKVAAYAWGEDYHQVIPARLEQLAAFIEGEAGRSLQYRAYTDTGPLLERDLAQRAGLGWIGKNTCLIHPRAGSYFFLAELLLDLELEPDPPFLEDRCGSCTRCLEACPTDCILPDRTLDAGRCISYLTIELKGSIMPELRPLMGEWVFGCDICQQVCPWNERFATEESLPEFAPRPGVARPDLVTELALSKEDFSRKFRGSPVKRAKRRGYLRNVAVALGNSKDSAAVPTLACALQEDPEPLVRAHAAWALGQIGGQAATAALQQAACAEGDRAVLEEIQTALDHLTLITG
jgi:epoxyqueuosine reductase